MNGYNALTGAAVKLGRWDHYLSLREGLLRLNMRHWQQLSNDLGAVAGLLFDVGSGRYAAPPREGDTDSLAAWREDLQRVRAETAAAARAIALAHDGDATHSSIQAQLRDLGRSLGFDVWVAANDRGRRHGDGVLGDGCLPELPWPAASGLDAVRLIDVLWLQPGSGAVAGAFEVEHSTSIYSGIVRMLDLALGSDLAAGSHLFLVAPDDREAQVAQQLRRPAFSRVAELGIRYLPYSELTRHAEAIGRFGSGLKPMLEISREIRA